MILLDIQMPEMNGFEVAKRIREREKTTGRHINIVAMTAGVCFLFYMFNQEILLTSDLGLVRGEATRNCLRNGRLLGEGSHSHP